MNKKMIIKVKFKNIYIIDEGNYEKLNDEVEFDQFLEKLNEIRNM